MSRKTSVLFYQPDDSETCSPYLPVHYTKAVALEPNILKREQGCTPPSKSVDSEDSGVKSASASYDDEENPKLSFSTGRRKSRVSMGSMPSSPVFDFPSFDELFETMGRTKLKIHRVSTSKYPIWPSLTSPDFDISENKQIMNDKEEISVNVGNTSCTTRAKLDRQDSVMTHSMSSLLIKYGQGSKDYQEFRQRVGNTIQHKYCMCCRMHSTIFMFLYVVFGFILVCTGVVCLLDCNKELLVSCYLIIDGVLSVFVFPILLMDWSKRIGGCISTTEKMGGGTFWTSVLLLRTLFVISGSIIAVYRCFHDPRPLDNTVCEIEFSVLVAAVITEWTVLVFVIFLPSCVCAALHIYAKHIIKTDEELGTNEV